MKKPSTAGLLGIGLVVLAFVISALAYGRLPDPVPTHWNAHGVADGYTPKPFGPFVLPIAMLGVYALLLAVPRISPKGFRVEGFKHTYAILMTTTLGVLLALTVVVHLVGMGYPVPINRVVPGIVGVLLIVLGNYMGKVTRNFFVGIRTPWTLANPEVWERTHRFGGRLMVAAGLVNVAAAFFGANFWILLASVLVAATIPIVYSYVIYQRVVRKEPGDNGNAGSL